MKRYFLFACAALLLAEAATAQEAPRIVNEKDRISYSVGYQIGGDLKKQGLEVNPELLLQGARDAMAGDKTLISGEEMNETLTNLKKKIDLAVADEKRFEAEKNLAAGKDFLDKNGKREGVTTLPSGLQYEILKEGAGSRPTADDNVSVHYIASLIDGTETDNTFAGSPVTFRAGATIPGWKEALQLMKEGARWKLFLPPDLAYGEKGTLKSGPNAVLIFDVELVAIKKAEK